MTLLAQAAPGTLTEWLGCLAFIIMLLNGGIKLLDRIKSKPPAEQLAITAQALEDRVFHLEQMREADLKASEESRRRLYLAVEAIRKELKVDLAGLQGHFNELPANIIAILKNTGVIRR
jgi:signal transduction protein with GAF and PtsI domain